MDRISRKATIFSKIACRDLLGKTQLSLQRSPHVRASKTVLGSGFRIPGTEFQSWSWNLDSGFQPLVGFRIPPAVFRIPKLRIPDSMRKIFLDSGFHKQKFPLHEAAEISCYYRKIRKISPGAYIFQRPFLRGLYSEGLMYGGKFAFQNRLG